MNNDMQEIAARLRALLDERGESQADLARVMGIDGSAVSRLVRGERGLGAAELGDICAYYGVTSDFILFGAGVGEPVGAVLRAEDGADATRVVERVESAFEDYRYVKALVGE